MDTIKYVDFNNNVYTINKKSILYLPVQPQNSSSGIYSGGQERNILISEDLFEEISKMVSRIIGNKDLLVEQRSMLTAMLIITAEGEIKKFIISKSEEQKALEKKLRTCF